METWTVEDPFSLNDRHMGIGLTEFGPGARGSVEATWVATASSLRNPDGLVS